jgi:hypothetical protein
MEQLEQQTYCEKSDGVDSQLINVGVAHDCDCRIVISLMRRSGAVPLKWLLSRKNLGKRTRVLTFRRSDILTLLGWVSAAGQSINHSRSH